MIFLFKVFNHSRLQHNVLHDYSVLLNRQYPYFGLLFRSEAHYLVVQISLPYDYLVAINGASKGNIYKAFRVLYIYDLIRFEWQTPGTLPHSSGPGL